MNKKLLAIILAMVMVFSMLAACGSNDADTNNDNNETQTDNNTTDDKNTEDNKTEGEDKGYGERTVVVGTRGGGEPYSYLQDDGTWTGVEAELWAEVEKRTGWTIEVKQAADMSALFGELDSGRIDVVANCAAITESRLENHIASDPIYADAQVIIVQPDSKYYTFEDLRGCTMGVQAGQAAQDTVEKMAEQYGWEVIPYESGAAGYQDCNLGRIDSFAGTVTSIEKTERTQNMEFRMLEEKLFGNNVGWWFRTDDESRELRDQLNKVLAEMQEDGTTPAIIEKWFYEDLTQLVSDQWLTSDR